MTLGEKKKSTVMQGDGSSSPGPEITKYTYERGGGVPVLIIGTEQDKGTRMNRDQRTVVIPSTSGCSQSKPNQLKSTGSQLCDSLWSKHSNGCFQLSSADTELFIFCLPANLCNHQLLISACCRGPQPHADPNLCECIYTDLFHPAHPPLSFPLTM